MEDKNDKAAPRPVLQCPGCGRVNDGSERGWFELPGWVKEGLLDSVKGRMKPWPCTGCHPGYRLATLRGRLLSVAERLQLDTEMTEDLSNELHGLLGHIGGLLQIYPLRSREPDAVACAYFKKFAHHLYNCAVIQKNEPCDCGYLAAEAHLRNLFPKQWLVANPGAKAEVHKATCRFGEGGPCDCKP